MEDQTELFDFLELDVDNDTFGSDSDKISDFTMVDVPEIQPTVPPSSSPAPTKLEAEGGAFNISWSNDHDRAPAPIPVRRESAKSKSPGPENGDESVKAVMPLPKPRGIRRAPEPEDASHAEKRLKNTDAARRSRLKKFLKIASLQKKVQELQSQNAQLSLRVAVLESDKAGWEVKESEYQKRLKQAEGRSKEGTPSEIPDLGVAGMLDFSGQQQLFVDSLSILYS
ncbi:hypothetical protein BC938DRAFT_470650 [Jimgerdemannia flammicorona]|uniref:BZIP domain-containing protein n=1 Tax=Jimgerdemannia flammicorona TaxID=994334 RepID=A0A433Q9Q7_9FUNG|nr:hypothetical protein BC938DRAFT_470650 [Jimgerdemannia flammicorona]